MTVRNIVGKRILLLIILTMGLAFTLWILIMSSPLRGNLLQNSKPLVGVKALSLHEGYAGWAGDEDYVCVNLHSHAPTVTVFNLRTNKISTRVYQETHLGDSWNLWTPNPKRKMVAWSDVINGAPVWRIDNLEGLNNHALPRDLNSTGIMWDHEGKGLYEWHVSNGKISLLHHNLTAPNTIERYELAVPNASPLGFSSNSKLVLVENLNVGGEASIEILEYDLLRRDRPTLLYKMDPQIFDHLVDVYLSPNGGKIAMATTGGGSSAIGRVLSRNILNWIHSKIGLYHTSEVFTLSVMDIDGKNDQVIGNLYHEHTEGQNYIHPNNVLWIGNSRNMSFTHQGTLYKSNGY